MKIVPALVVSAVLAVAAAPAHASNSLYITSPESELNVVTSSITGDLNALSVFQQHDGTGASNSLKLVIDGDLNGGTLNSSFSPVIAASGLTPGHIEQIGHENAMAVQITGNENLFAMSQIGYGNSLTATVVGNYNQAAVSQTGSGNMLAFTQNGNGNMLSVVQRSSY